MTELNLAQQIKQQFEAECRFPFPLDDVRRLRSRDAANLGLFHGQLEMYLSYIAGYASSADRLGRRPRAELIEARKNLSQSFFEKYRSLAVYRDAITEGSTPDLFRDLLTADKLRKELLVVIDEILEKEPVPKK
jgi:hypothetical protein